MSTHTVVEWPLRRLMAEVVGSGHKSPEEMNRGQAREAVARILTGEPRETTLSSSTSKRGCRIAVSSDFPTLLLLAGAHRFVENVFGVSRLCSESTAIELNGHFGPVALQTTLHF